MGEGFAAPILVCNHEHRFLVAEQLRLAGIAAPRILLEPAGRNSAPAIAAAALLVAEQDPDAVLWMLAADHAIANAAALQEALAAAVAAARAGRFVTFGMRPAAPETGYGYIELGEALEGLPGVHALARFIEKPDAATAAGLSYGAVYWYFSSKDDLFHALMDLEDAALRARIAQALDERADLEPRESLRRAITATFEFFEEDKAAVKLLFRDSYALGGRFETHLFGIYERFTDDLATFFAAAQRRGEIIVVPPRVAAFSVAALIGQLAYRRLTTDDGLAAPVVADFVIGLVMDGLRPR